MNHFTVFLITVGILFVTLQACGPDEEELRQQELAEEQARQDSLEHVMEAERQQMQQDEIEQQTREEALQAEEEALSMDYNPDGRFTVQVQSWRSKEKAEQQAEMWKNRGFTHAYIVQYGDEETGDVWFRVRLGNVSSYDMANRLQEKLQKEHQTNSWIDTAYTRTDNE